MDVAVGASRVHRIQPTRPHYPPHTLVDFQEPIAVADPRFDTILDPLHALFMQGDVNPATGNVLLNNYPSFRNFVAAKLNGMVFEDKVMKPKDAFTLMRDPAFNASIKARMQK